MNKVQNHFLLLVVFVVGMILVIFNMDRMWSEGVDLAHHYALAFRISEGGGLLGRVDDPTLGEMNVYPRMSHTLAAFFGMIFNSVFLGVHFVSLLALALLWAGVIFIVNSLPMRAAYLSLIGLSCLMALNRGYLNFEIHGGELLTNFFFSQLVAQSVVISTIAMAVFLDIKKCSNWTIVSLLMVAILVTTGIHPLPALELLGVLLGVLVADNLVLSSEPRSQRLKKSLWHLVVAIVAVAFVFLNPAFTVMRKISKNNGDMPLVHVSGTSELVLLSTFALVVSGLLLFVWHRGKKSGGFNCAAFKYLGLYGASVASLCLVQILALGFGYGSEYAAKKYVFGIFSCLIVSIAVLLGVWFKDILNGPLWLEGLLRNTFSRSLITSFAFSTVFVFSLSQSKAHSVSNIVALERQLIKLQGALPSSLSAKTNIVNLSNMPAAINYMFSIAIMKTPRELAGPDALFSRELRDVGKYENIITTNASPYYHSACDRHVSSGSVAVLDTRCVASTVVYSNFCRGEYDLSSAGSIGQLTIRGFSGPEDHGRWTDGENARFNCTVPAVAPKKIRISVLPFFYGAHQRQRLIVAVKSTAEEYVFNGKLGQRSIEFSLPATEVGEKLEVNFRTPDAISPKRLGVSQDGRLLGVSIKSVAFE